MSDWIPLVHKVRNPEHQFLTCLTTSNSKRNCYCLPHRDNCTSSPMVSLLWWRTMVSCWVRPWWNLVHLLLSSLVLIGESIELWELSPASVNISKYWKRHNISLNMFTLLDLMSPQCIYKLCWFGLGFESTVSRSNRVWVECKCAFIFTTILSFGAYVICLKPKYKFF